MNLNPVPKYRLPMSSCTDKIFWLAKQPGGDAFLKLDTYTQDQLWECMMGAASGGKLQLLIFTIKKLEHRLTDDGFENLAWKAAQSGHHQIVLYIKKQQIKLKCCCDIMWDAYRNNHLTILMYFNSICKHYNTRNAIIDTIDQHKPGADDLFNALYYEDMIDPDPSIHAISEWKRIKDSYMEVWRYFVQPPPKKAIQSHDDIYQINQEIEEEERVYKEKKKNNNKKKNKNKQRK